MKYTVTANNIIDTGKGYYESDHAEAHGLTEKAAVKKAEFYKAQGLNRVFISFFRPSDGQAGYLNPIEGHGITGKSWA